jgi:hypothetical protein
MNSRRYLKPTIIRVDLRPEEAVLSSCKTQGTLSGFQVDPLTSGYCQLEVYHGESLIGYGTCQLAGT